MMSDASQPLLSSMRACNETAGGFFSTTRTITYYEQGAMLGMHFGERRIGKTLYWSHVACYMWMTYGKTTLWLRNRLTEVQDPNFTSSFLADCKDMGWCPEEWEARSDGVYTCEGKDGEKVIEFSALSVFSNARGGAHPNCELIILDEALDESGRFPKQACKGLLSLSKTYLNGRETARVVLLSNTTTALNPYYAHLRIYPTQRINFYPDKGVFVEKCNGQYRKSIGKRNAWQAVYKAGVGYGEYADETEDPRITLIQRIPKGAKVQDWGIISNSNRYRIWEHKGRLFFGLWKGNPNGCIWYCADRADISDEVIYLDRSVRKNLKALVDNGIARFDNPNTMFDILTAIYEE